MTSYLLGIDAGTSVIKAAVFDERGTELSRGAANVPISNPKSYEAEEDMETVWIAATTAIRDAITGSAVRPREIIAISVTGQGDGSWLIDKNGKPAGPAILWTDGRTGSIIDEWYTDGTVTKQFDISGTGPYAGTASAILRWRRDNQRELLEGATQLWCKDWIEYRLTGDISTDASDASLSGIDARTRQWSDEVLRTWGIEDIKHVLPKIKSSTDLAGEITEEAAGVTGLIAGTPVYKGQMDITASSLGVGVARPGDCMAVIGTAGIVTVATDTLEHGFEPADSGWVIPHSPDTWIRAMGMNFCTPNLDWFLAELGAAFSLEARGKNIDIFDYLDEVVTETPVGAEGVLYHGYLAPGGERAPFVKPSARGSFNGITGSHTRRHMLRAVYEGVAYGIRDCLDSIPTEVKTVRMAGGGANSAVWCQIFADVLGRTIIVPAGTEFGAKGAAIVAGVGAGVFASYAQGADATVNIVRTYEPNRDNTKIYDRFFPVYRSIRTAMLPIWDELQAATRTDEQ
ncbi:carbohydrate kinase [Pseudoclavibacter sp. RFBJ3]|uniref:FGGY-family carbohydrate kinase n=1 Tax=unclassified Pseudoclavibacter TaxID=2615177 RepID=UPI000CE8D167|nr:MULTISPECIES: FGGY-family carbohydrate kinase [unclassified Pseudoclavibacter]PPF82545.1 carbohydrate kinase [Pseudoclavibacter sp. RFBJ5]PPF91439.1 carbohydrate kinase [Pseudoclavibacter sp. RFBJ3]PPF96363.1 carbohydrate kinase [Pseudoclavibacter sp. RFBH5]PPG22109.1 carbohydrate kinase [Pseudoclavibacter sp. RFBI4]